MSEKSKALRVTRIQTQVFGAVSAEQAWVPAVNVYDCGASLHICVELAGVPREAISVTVKPGRLMIQGRREVPEPADQKTRCIREMEIDHGLFNRVLILPDTVDLDAVQSRYEDGLLWIILPVKR